MKKIVFTLIAIVVLGVISTMMIKKEITVSRTTSISSPIEKVAAQIYHFDKFIKWSPWVKLDTVMKFEFFGESGQVGAKYTWTGNDEVGTG